jgi:hypothetical protein
MEATRRLDEWRKEEQVPFQLWLRLLTAQALAQAHRRHLGALRRDAKQEIARFTASGRNSALGCSPKRRSAPWFSPSSKPPNSNQPLFLPADQTTGKDRWQRTRKN